MYELTVFNRHRMRVELAIQEWVIQWKMEECPLLRCPSCRSEQIGKVMQPKGLKTHVCSKCREQFSLNDVPGCYCTIPGKLSKCYECKHYKAMERYIEKRLPALEALDDATITKRFDPTRYKLRDSKRYPPEDFRVKEFLISDPDAQWVQTSLLDEEYES